MKYPILALLCVLPALVEVRAQVSNWAFDVKETDAAPSIRRGGAMFGVPVETLYSTLGVSFSGAGKSRPVEDVYVVGNGYAYFGMISNHPLAGTSAGKPLVIRFSQPVKKFGFRPVRDPTFEMELRAYTDDNEFLGSVRKPGRTDSWSMPGLFFGIKTTHPTGMSCVILDYGQIEEPETIFEMWWVPVVAPTYVRWLAQVGAGQMGGLRFETEIQIQELVSTDLMEITVELYDPAGSPMSLNLNGTERSSIVITPRPGNSARVYVSNSDQAKVGYARVTSPHPIGVNGIYRTFAGGGGLLHEAGVEAGPMRFVHRIPVERSAARGVDTAIAIVNDDQEQYVDANLFDSWGPSFRSAGIAQLFSQEKRRALYLEELFKDLPEEFEGTLIVESQRGTAVTVIRTINGVAASSLPTASTEP